MISEQVRVTSSYTFPPISVVVCTRDRAQILQRCLVALSLLDYSQYEVVVVDNASRNADTAQVVAATPFRYVREEQVGLDWARNRGASEATHDIIAYVDDDVLVEPGWLRGVATALADPDVVAMTGLVLAAELETEAQQLFEKYGGMGKGWQPRVFKGRSLKPRDLIAAHQVGVGANMAFRRRTFEQVGKFDTGLDVGTPSGGCGDLDMFHRILVAGLTLRYEPNAVVRHQHRRDIVGLRKQLYNNGRGFGVYLIKIWKTGQLKHLEILRYTIWEWLSGWLMWRLVRCLIGRYDLPLTLIWAEIRGALSAPWAYHATYYYDHQRCSG